MASSTIPGLPRTAIGHKLITMTIDGHRGRCRSLVRSGQFDPCCLDHGDHACLLFDKLMRAGEGKILKRLARIAEQVNAIEEDFVTLTDAELRKERRLQAAPEPTVRRWTTCFPRLSRPCVRPPSAPWDSATTTSRSWAVQRFTWGTSPR